MKPEDYTLEQALDPTTPGATLQDIAMHRPDLRPAIARNPSTYPDLVTWLGQLGDPAVNEALASRTSTPVEAAPVPQPQQQAAAPTVASTQQENLPPVPMPAGQVPGPEFAPSTDAAPGDAPTKKSRRGLWIGVGVGALAVVGAGAFALNHFVFSKMGGAESPEAAAQQLMDALTGSDDVALYGSLSPIDREYMADVMEQFSSHIEEQTGTEEFGDDLLDLYRSFDLTADNVTFSVEELTEDYARVELSTGDFTLDVDDAKMSAAINEIFADVESSPLGDIITEAGGQFPSTDEVATELETAAKDAFPVEFSAQDLVIPAEALNSGLDGLESDLGDNPFGSDLSGSDTSTDPSGSDSSTSEPNDYAMSEEDFAELYKGILTDEEIAELYESLYGTGSTGSDLGSGSTSDDPWGTDDSFGSGPSSPLDGLLDSLGNTQTGPQEDITFALIAVKEGDGWYISPSLTMVDLQGAMIGVEADFSKVPEPSYADSPEQAATDLVASAFDSVKTFDFAGLSSHYVTAERRTGVIQPDLGLADADLQEIEAIFNEFTVSDAAFSVDRQEGDTAYLKLDSLTIDGQVEGTSIALDLSSECFGVKADVMTVSVCIKDVPAFEELGLDELRLVARKESEGWAISSGQSSADSMGILASNALRLQTEGKLTDEQWWMDNMGVLSQYLGAL